MWYVCFDALAAEYYITANELDTNTIAGPMSREDAWNMAEELNVLILSWEM